MLCPVHGCAFNVCSGSVEYAPAMDQLPIFFVSEKDEKISLFFPKHVPTKIRPLFA